MITIYHSGGLTKNPQPNQQIQELDFVKQLNGPFLQVLSYTHSVLAPQDTFHWGPHFITLRQTELNLNSS